MKKFIAGILVGVLISSSIAYAATYVANVANFKVMVNGKEFTSDPPALVVEGRTYLPLRAMGDALGVPVSWNEELRQAVVGNVPTQYNFISYSECEWCPDFGKFFGISEVYKHEDDECYMWLYNGKGITNEKIDRYIKTIVDSGFKKDIADNTIMFMSNDGLKRIAIHYGDDNQIWIYVNK